ncbi:MAG: protein kinase [Myxococcota bacterium]|nr:protein kinase [Myxococcota bacterium]MDW8364120.1 protein kinase [Myxococcales bacterium]
MTQDGRIGRSGGTGESLADRERRLRAEEHATNIVRMGRVVRLGVLAWLAFFVIDLLVATWITPGPAWPFAVVRAAFLPVLIALIWRLGRQPPPTPRQLAWLDVVGFGTCAFCVGLMTAWHGGLGSPYAAGVSVVSAARGVSVMQHWRQGAAHQGVVVLGGLLGILVASAAVPEHRAQFTDPVALASFAQFQAFVVNVAGFTAYGSHVAWKLRREVFEARSIGKYQMRRLLGRGGMGEVWAALHPGLGREVALKILRPEGVDDVALERFRREVQALGELTHPNTVRVYDHGVTEDGLCYFAMELLEGEDLATLVSRTGPLPPERAVHLVLQAARALSEAHGRGIVHRDLKPENVFVTHAGLEGDFVKLLDFGIAKWQQHEPGATLTQVGAIAGTPRYISPEAARGAPVTPASDVYSLGAVLYFALAARPPFDGQSVGALLVAHLHEEPVPPSRKLGRPLPQDLEEVVLRTLRKQPDERYPDGHALAEALAQCQCAGHWKPPLWTPNQTGVRTRVSRDTSARQVGETAPTLPAMDRSRSAGSDA